MPPGHFITVPSSSTTSLRRDLRVYSWQAVERTARIMTIDNVRILTPGYRNYNHHTNYIMQVKLYNQSGETKGTVELPDSVFGLKWNADLVKQVVDSYRANQRRPIAHAKDRAQVRGGGRKPWRQKGTGRARHGSIRSPIWKGGGVTHGPLKEKNYTKKINKKMAKKAFYTVLSAKARDGEIIIFDDLKFKESKTKLAAEVFNNLSKVEKFQGLKKGNGVLVALSRKDENVRRALRNLPYTQVDEARNLNAYEVLQYKYILFPQKALEVFNGKAS